MDPQVVAEARDLARKIQKDKSDGQLECVETLHRKAAYTLGTQLVQVARNSLLDADSLR